MTRNIDFEEWRDIKGFEGHYQVSNLGRVKSLERVTQLNGRQRRDPTVIMKHTLRSGYPVLALRKDGKRYSKQIHRLVAEAFLPNPDRLPVVNHKNFNREDNRLENLEWCSQRENVNWSKQNMCKPKSVCRKSNTGEKYIYKKRDGLYRVSITANCETKEWKFNDLEKAIKFRDETIKELSENSKA